MIIFKLIIELIKTVIMIPVLITMTFFSPLMFIFGLFLEENIKENLMMAFHIHIEVYEYIKKNWKIPKYEFNKNNIFYKLWMGDI